MHRIVPSKARPRIRRWLVPALWLVCGLHGRVLAAGTPSPTPADSSTPTPLVTDTVSPTISQTVTFSDSPTPSLTPTVTPTFSQSATFSASPTPSISPTSTPAGGVGFATISYVGAQNYPQTITRGSLYEDFTITYYANGSTWANGLLVLEIPAGWPAPQTITPGSTGSFTLGTLGGVSGLTQTSISGNAISFTVGALVSDGNITFDYLVTGTASTTPGVLPSGGLPPLNGLQTFNILTSPYPDYAGALPIQGCPSVDMEVPNTNSDIDQPPSLNPTATFLPSSIGLHPTQTPWLMRRAVFAPVPAHAGEAICVAGNPAAAVQGDVFDLAGEKVAGFSAAAGQPACWQTGSSAPGIYFVRLQSAGQVSWHKVAIIH